MRKSFLEKRKDTIRCSKRLMENNKNEDFVQKEIAYFIKYNHTNPLQFILKLICILVLF